jgi:anti-anti-sigma factor
MSDQRPGLDLLEGSASTLVVAHGDMDYEASKTLRGTIDRVLDVHPQALVLDFGDVDFVDSSGVAMILRMRRSVLADGGMFTICSVSDPVRRTLALCGLLEALGLEPTGVA